jgi:hypothetical protein
MRYTFNVFDGPSLNDTKREAALPTLAGMTF